MAALNDGKGITGLPHPRGLLPYIHPELRFHKPPAHSAAEGSLRLDATADQAFDALKQALVASPMLQLPDFDATIINCDTFGTGFGVVLHQDGDPIAFYIRPITPLHDRLAAYERELIGLVKAMRH
jgi:hypothetical protein